MIEPLRNDCDCGPDSGCMCAWEGMTFHSGARVKALTAERDELRQALCELHRAVTEDDGSDCDEARLRDALEAAQKLAPHVPKPFDPEAF